MGIDGAQGVVLVDYESGMLLGEAGAGMDMEVAAAGNTEVIRAKMKTAASLNLNDGIEDILISLGKAYHHAPGGEEVRSGTVVPAAGRHPHGSTVGPGAAGQRPALPRARRHRTRQRMVKPVLPRLATHVQA